MRNRSKMFWNAAVATGAAALIVAVATAGVHGQASAPGVSKTVLDGVFTAAQEDRGRVAYGGRCAMCHDGVDVDGPSLTGSQFIDRWREDTLDRLFEFIKGNMPQGAPGSLPDATYLDILAHLLHENGYPAGAGELTVNTVASTLVVGEKGPQPLPSGALVRVVGCLARNPAQEWVMVRASGPARVRSGKDILPAEVATAAAATPGSQTFALQNLGDSGTAIPGNGNEGQKVVIKGALTQRANGSRIHVTAAQSVAATCP
jgi:hypothetical protein